MSTQPVIEDTEEDTPEQIAEAWTKFRESGLLGWINMILHTFGWAITVVIRVDEAGTQIVDYVIPKRVKYRGFSVPDTTEIYQKVTLEMHCTSDELLEDVYGEEWESKVP